MKFQWYNNGNFNEMSIEINWKSSWDFNEIPMEIGNYEFKRLLKLNRNNNEIPMEIQLKLQWRKVEISMKLKWKSIGNLVGIQ